MTRISSGISEGIKGAKFVYEAQAADRKDWSPVMKTLAANEANPADLSPFSAPVISVKLGQKTVPARFKAGESAVQLKSALDEARAWHITNLASTSGS